MRPLFDAHLDLAYLAVNGRDMAAPLDPAAGPHPPAAVTLPELEAANIRFALATIFTEMDSSEPQGYPAGDAERAHKAGRAQLEAYFTWRDKGFLAIDLPGILAPDPSVGEVRAGMGVSEVVRTPIGKRIARLPARPPLHIGILMECADPIKSPDELSWWAARGVCAIGLAWGNGSRYSGGNMTPEQGLTDSGRALIKEMDRLGIIHDASHLSDPALEELLSMTNKPIIASHSNCRALLSPGGTGVPPVSVPPQSPNHRHLPDWAITEIARRGGVIGLNLVRNFIRADLNRGDANDRPSIDDALRHVDHICSLAGHLRAVGLGTDLDGGISAHDLPRGIDRAGDLHKLLEALAARGWTEEGIDAFAWRNWAEVFAGLRAPR